MAVDAYTVLPLMGEIPKHWRVVRLGAVLDGGSRNGVYKAKEFHGRGVKIVNMGELFAHPRLRAIDMKRIELTNEELARFDLRAGDLLFARRSLVAAGAGKCSIVLEVDEPTTFESSIIRARPDPTKADSLFLFYLFSSPFGGYALGTILRHVAVAGITGSDLVKLDIPLPPLSEQRAIAQVLGALDDKIELSRRINETLKAMAQAIFKSWFVDFDPIRAKAAGHVPEGVGPGIATLFPDRFQQSDLGEIPASWNRIPIFELAEINAWMLGKNDKQDRIEYIEISEVSRGDIGSIQVFERGKEPSRARRKLRHGDTVMSTVRPDRGSYFLCLHPSPYSIASTGFAVITPTHAPWSFIHTALTRPDVFEHLGQQADGGAYPAISPEIIGKWQVAWPDQSAIVGAFQQICGPLYELAEENRQQSRTLALLRDALLPNLLSGQLRVCESQTVAEI